MARERRVAKRRIELAERFEQQVPERHRQIDTTREGSTVVVRLIGDFDFGSRDELVRAFETAVSVRSTQQVIADLRRADFVDSTVVGILVMAQKRARQLGIRFVLGKGPPAVHRPFEIMNIDRYLTFVDL